MTRSRLLVLSALALALTGALAACTAAPVVGPDTEATPPASAAIVTIADLEGLTAADAVDVLEAVPMDERVAEFSASVHPQALMLTDAAGEETEMPFPAGQFHLSIAPYVDQTHDCYFHNLMTCHGELGGHTFEVTVADAEGAVIFEDTMVAEDNGYVGFWLPAGIQASVTVRDGDRVGTAEIATGPDDLTCLTSLRLV